MSDNTNRKPRRDKWERDAIKAIMVRDDVKYTAALRKFEDERVS